MTSISNLEFTLFKSFILEKCGIELAYEKAYLIESRLAKFLVQLNVQSYGELYNEIKKSRDTELTGEIIDAITTNETLWFRDKSPWEILQKQFLPKYIAELREGKRDKVRIWSAAASTGQEAYSTAICIDSYLKQNLIQDITLSHFEIFATDISKFAIEVAQKGRFDSIVIMRGLEKSIRDRYFVNVNSAYEIIEPIKKAVKFRQFNLQNSFAGFSKFDVVFCRYVLIYFSQSFKTDVLTRLCNNLDDKGVLFLGSYEMCEFISDLYLKNQHENAIYYTKK